MSLEAVVCCGWLEARIVSCDSHGVGKFRSRDDHLNEGPPSIQSRRNLVRVGKVQLAYPAESDDVLYGRPDKRGICIGEYVEGHRIILIPGQL